MLAVEVRTLRCDDAVLVEVTPRPVLLAVAIDTLGLERAVCEKGLEDAVPDPVGSVTGEVTSEELGPVAFGIEELDDLVRT